MYTAGGSGSASGVPCYAVTEGTLMSGTSSADVTAQAASTTAVGNLLVMVLYATVDPGNARDAGEGWVLLDSAFDAGNSFGVAIWVAISRRAGTTRSGLTLASAGNWANAVAIFRLAYASTWPEYNHLFWDLAGRVRGGTWYSGTADSRTMSWSPMEGPGVAGNGFMGIELLGAGCYNGGTVPTATAPTGYTERIDQGVATGAMMNVSLNYRTPTSANGTLATDYALQTVSVANYYSVSGAQTNRAAVRGFIPIGGSCHYPGAYLSHRRMRG